MFSMPALVLALFCLAIAATAVFHVSLIWALASGWCLFFVFALSKGQKARDLARTSCQGLATVFQVVSTLLCIGMLTASWRASGTIAYLVDLALQGVTPTTFLPCAFICNAGISFLLGSSFATAATMGVISMSVAHALDFSPLLTGGAILSGCYFGDRCSPMSTSSLLVCTLSRVEIWRLIPLLFKTCAVPFALTIALCAACALMTPADGSIPDTRTFFRQEYALSPLLTLPALLVLSLALLRVRVRTVVLLSTALALALCLTIQHMPPFAVPALLTAGFEAKSPVVGRLMNGGGIVSMLEVVGIVSISSTYAGLFRASGLLDGLSRVVDRLRRAHSFLPYTVCGLLTGAIACNQTLAIMLTHQLTEPLSRDKIRHALDMEDSVLLLAVLIPWSIASAVPLAMVQAPLTSVALAFYIWLVPLWRFVWTPKHIDKREP